MICLDVAGYCTAIALLVVFLLRVWHTSFGLVSTTWCRVRSHLFWAQQYEFWGQPPRMCSLLAVFLAIDNFNFHLYRPWRDVTGFLTRACACRLHVRCPRRVLARQGFVCQQYLQSYSASGLVLLDSFPPDPSKEQGGPWRSLL